MNIYKKISAINKKGSEYRIKFKPVFEINNNYLNYYKKEELMDLARENYNIYQRLNSKNSSYNLYNHLRDYEKAQYYKKNYCKYPSIDFYRTSKSSSSCSIFNYCTFNNYNKYNNEYNKKIIYKNKSASSIYNTNNERQKKSNNNINQNYEYYNQKDKSINKFENNNNNKIKKNLDNDFKEEEKYLPLLIDKIQYGDNDKN